MRIINEFTGYFIFIYHLHFEIHLEFIGHFLYKYHLHFKFNYYFVLITILIFS